MRRVLVDFDFLGETLGLVIDGEPVVVTRDDGTSRSYVVGAELDSLPARTAPVIGDDAGGDGGMQMTLSQAVVSLWRLRRTAPLQLATATVYWWPEGEVLRSEHEIFRGVVREPDWDLTGVAVDDRAGSVSFNLAPYRRSDDAPFPPAGIGEDGRFPAAPDESKSMAVPVIYGTAKGVPLFALNVANPTRLIVSGHRVVSSTINVMRDDVVVSGAEPIMYAFDGRGDEYAYVEIALVVYTAGSTLYADEVIGWANPDKTAVDGLGDVMIHAFKTYGGASWFELDRRRVEAARPKLNRLKVGLYVNDRNGGTLMRFLDSRLAGQFPVAMSFAGGRLGWDAALFPRSTDFEISARIVFGQNAHERIGPRQTSADDVLSEIEFSYGLDGFQAGNTLSEHLDKTNNGDCRRAMSRWGPSPVHAVQASDCPDAATAYILATDIALKRTRVRNRVEYHGVDDYFFDLPMVCVVEVTDADLGWVNEPCLLESARPRLDGLCDVVLITVDGE